MSSGLPASNCERPLVLTLLTRGLDTRWSGMIGGFRDSAGDSCPRIRLWKCLEKIPVPQFQHKHLPQQGGPVPSSTEMLVYQRADRSRFEVATLQASWLQQELQELVLHLAPHPFHQR